MKYLFSYFPRCIKKSFKSFLTIFLTTILLVVSLFLVAMMLFNANNDDAARQKIKVGMVGDLTDSYMGVSFEALETMEIDDISLSLQFIEFKSEEEAIEALKNFGISSYIFVPDNYVTDFASGKDVKLTFVMPKTSASAQTMLISEIVKILSPLITKAEAGIYAMRDYHRDNKIPDMSRDTDILNMKYIETIFTRGSSSELVVRTGILSLTEYYACGIVIFFLLLFAIACCVIFANKQLSLGRLLCSRGAKPWHLVIGEYLAYVTIMLLLVFIIATACAFIPLSGELSGIAFIKIAFALIPSILMIAAMQFLIYEATGGIVTGVLAQFIVAVAMGYISGCFYPYYFFPESVQKFAAVLPSSVAFEFLRNYISGIPSGNILKCMLYTIGFLVPAVAIRTYRLRRDTL